MANAITGSSTVACVRKNARANRLPSVTVVAGRQHCDVRLVTAQRRTGYVWRMPRTTLVRKPAAALEHPNPDRYTGQRVFVVRREDYVYLVPFPP
jgi:hypothetical protein